MKDSVFFLCIIEFFSGVIVGMFLHWFLSKRKGNEDDKTGKDQ